MDKVGLYRILDIDTPEEFRYYENLAALLEEENVIEDNLIADLIRTVDRNVLSEQMNAYIENFMKNLPDEENDLYITLDTIGNKFAGMIAEDMTDEEISRLAEEIVRFRKWYVQDKKVHDLIKNEDVSIRDARYGIMAAGFLGEDHDYDFTDAEEYDIDGYDVFLSDIIGE